MMDPTIESRLARAEQLLASTAEQTIANAESIANLQKLSSDTRADMAHMSEWAEQVTEAIAESRLIQQQLVANQQQMTTNQQQMATNQQQMAITQQQIAELQRSLAAGQERQEAILLELIRQRGSSNGSA